MGIGDRLRRLDDNPFSEAVYDQYTAPFTWWLLTGTGIVAVAIGAAKGSAPGVVVGVVLVLFGLTMSVLTRRRDRRLEDARRERVESDMAARRARREGR